MKSVLVMLADGFEEIEALTVVDVLRRAGVKCDMCSLAGETVEGAHGIKVIVDLEITSEDTLNYDAIVLPGGMPGAENLRNSAHTLDLLREYYRSGKLVAAICAAPIVLAEAGLLKGRSVTSFPGFKERLGNCIYQEDIVVLDENILTSRGPATALPFAYSILRKLGLEEEEKKLREAMLFSLIEG